MYGGSLHLQEAFVQQHKHKKDQSYQDIHIVKAICGTAVIYDHIKPCGYDDTDDAGLNAFEHCPEMRIVRKILQYG